MLNKWEVIMRTKNKQILTAVIVVGLLAGVFLAFFSANEQDETVNQQASEEELEQGSQTEEAALFNPLPMDEVGFRATLTGTSNEGPVDAIMEYDGEGSSRFESTQNGQVMEFIITPTAAYSCENSNCVMFDTTTDNMSFFNPEDYTYGDGDYATFRDEAVYLGREDCPAGTCHAWEVEDEDTTSLIYIETQTTRISQVVSSGPDGDITVTYEYEDITITPPENAQALPSFDQ